MVKQQVIDLIQSLPEDCTLEDIQYHLYVCEKVERGIRAVEEGRLVSEEEFRTWQRAGLLRFAQTYGPDEPEYTEADLKIKYTK